MMTDDYDNDGNDNDKTLLRTGDRYHIEYFSCIISFNFHSSLLFHLSEIGKDVWV